MMFSIYTFKARTLEARTLENRKSTISAKMVTRRECLNLFPGGLKSCLTTSSVPLIALSARRIKQNKYASFIPYFNKCKVYQILLGLAQQI